MTSTTDALACECARSDEEVVRDRVEGWTVSTRTTDCDDVGCAECSDASGLWSTNDVSSRDFLASDTAVPCARTTGRPYVAWHYGDTAEEELSEWTLSLEVKVHSELVQDVDVSNIRERCSLEGASGVEIGVAVLYVPSSDGTAVLPMIASIHG